MAGVHKTHFRLSSESDLLCAAQAFSITYVASQSCEQSTDFTASKLPMSHVKEEAKQRQMLYNAWYVWPPTHHQGLQLGDLPVKPALRERLVLVAERPVLAESLVADNDGWIVVE